MKERDFTEGHPASCDYNGEKYVPPRAPHSQDYDEQHPAYAGGNISDGDTPDGKMLQSQLDHEESARRTLHIKRSTPATQVT